MPVILPATEILVIRPGNIQTYYWEIWIPLKSRNRANSRQDTIDYFKGQTHNVNPQPCFFFIYCSR